MDLDGVEDIAIHIEPRWCMDECKRMLIKCEWIFKDDKAPDEFTDCDDELRKILQVMKDKKIKPTRVQKKKDLIEVLEYIGCYDSNKEYIDLHLTPQWNKQEIQEIRDVLSKCIEIEGIIDCIFEHSCLIYKI